MVMAYNVDVVLTYITRSLHTQAQRTVHDAHCVHITCRTHLEYYSTDCKAEQITRSWNVQPPSWLNHHHHREIREKAHSIHMHTIHE